MSDPFDLDNLSEMQPSEQMAENNIPPFYLEGLNPPQLEAIRHIDGPILVLAGAGTGKTRVLTTRLAHILATGRAYPNQILAVTFTNKAAHEMKDRVGAIIGSAVENMFWLGTFHSICVKILRRHADLVGLGTNFTILDQDDQLRLIKQLVRAADIDEKRFPPRMLAGLIDSWKNKGLLPGQVPKSEAHFYADGKGLDLYESYQNRLKALNAADFGDLILLCVTLFQKNPHILSEYQKRFRYILIDEYQDTNVAQYLWLRLLAMGHKNICCVGDDDQSIYGWRGAEVGNILKFEKDFEGAKIVRLEQNYRSTTHILGAASGLINSNRDRLGKTLWTAEEGGEKVSVNAVWDGRAEARAIGEIVEDLQRKKQPLNEMAILVRAGFQTREFEENFITLGIPYRIIGGVRFYERAEIRDAMAYLRVLQNPDDDLAFERIINVPKRGIGDTTVAKLHRIARAAGTSLVKASIDIVETDEISKKARTALAQLLQNFDRWRTIAQDVNHLDITDTILEESGYYDKWRNDKSPDAPGKLENLAELIRGMEAFENLEEFLEHISLVMENTAENQYDSISIMTLHGSKGLEFDTVFLPGWEEELFPSRRSIEEQGERGLEEERRLAYVGITRAKKRAYIFYAATRYMFGNYMTPIPSRFIEELPKEHIVKLGQQGLTNSDQRDFNPSGNLGFNFGEGREFYQLDRSRAKKRFPNTVSTSRKSAASEFAIGERVFHDKFGYGQVTEIEGNKLTIDFEMGSERKVMDSFIKSA
ncbi:MAG: UvrD-helicase domain-containing protein [Alphaproteobacteria bacterium]|nr:UvrD-helicase domain-containing protein [Alphaproteobacteria bacterium]HPF45405.1 UvrD-helicase domain-containing protein [Emcibacteraceae bacterium]